MLITHDTDAELVLSGRRQDGEVGEPGLWIVWLVGLALTSGGVVFFLTDDTGARWMTGAVALAGLGVLAFGLCRLARRERLRLDLARKTMTYGHRVWPRGWRTQFEASFEDVTSIRLQQKTESPGGGQGEPSRVYDVTEALLSVGPHHVVELDRHPDGARVRQLAERVAAAVGATING